MMVVGSYHALPESLMAIIRKANSAKELRSKTPAKLYVYETLLKWPPENFKDTSLAISGSTSEPASLIHGRLLC
jgi:hypothetical protein